MLPRPFFLILPYSKLLVWFCRLLEAQWISRNCQAVKSKGVDGLGYLLKRGREREICISIWNLKTFYLFEGRRRGAIFPLPIHSLNVCDSWSQARLRSEAWNSITSPVWVVGPRCFPGWALAGSGMSRAGTQMGCKHSKQQLTHHAKLMLSLWCSIQAISEPTRATLWVKALPWLWCSDLTGTTTGAFLVSSALPPQPTTTHTPLFQFLTRTRK